MTVRTTKESVTFANAFTLDEGGEVFPPGVYRTESDEERLVGPSFPVYRRVRTVILLPTRSGGSGTFRTREIDPDDLERALRRDRSDEQVVPVD